MPPTRRRPATSRRSKRSLSKVMPPSIFARLAMERGKLGEELTERPAADHRPGEKLELDPELDPATVSEPPRLLNPLLDGMLWHWENRDYALEYAKGLYEG
jgi:hypothetical protein